MWQYTSYTSRDGHSIEAQRFQIFRPPPPSVWERIETYSSPLEAAIEGLLGQIFKENATGNCMLPFIPYVDSAILWVLLADNVPTVVCMLCVAALCWPQIRESLASLMPKFKLLCYFERICTRPGKSN